MIAAGTRLGPYEVLDTLGRGGMGEVYRARDTRLDRSVALKVLPAHLSTDSDFRLRFEREARLISGLNHPNICTLHDVGESSVATETGPVLIQYLVMELLDGQSLAERLDRGPLPLDQALRYAIQIADALERAHRSGVIHRDLKPGNVMITKTGAKLVDFGLAKPGGNSPFGAASSSVLDRPTEQRPLTAEGAIVGTMQYMAPEQLEGADADARSDIFAFGAILYEMICGQRAFEAKSKASLIAAILEREPRPIAEVQPLVPPPLDRIVRTCLAKDPEERWQSAHDLRRELEWVRDDASSPSQAAAARPGTRRRVRLSWGVVIALPLLAAALTWLVMRETASPPKRLVAALAPPPGTSFIVTGDAAGPVTLSPDGRYAAFVTSGSTASLWIESLENGSVTRLPGTEGAMFPFWSPDSRSIGFFAEAKLLTIDIDGSSPRVITTAPDARGGSWSVRGDILFTPTTQSPIFRIPAAGGTPVAVTKIGVPYSTHRWPAFLPDGTHFVYLAATHNNPESADTAIFLASTDGRENRRLFASMGSATPWRDWILYLQGNRLVAQKMKDLSPAGKPVPVWENVLYDAGTWRSIFSVSDSGLLAVHGSAATNILRLVVLDRTGAEIGEIGPPGEFRDVAVSPDGRKLLIGIGDPKTVIYVQDLERGVRTRLSFTGTNLVFPTWTPDGKNAIFTSVAPENFTILIKPVDGSTNERPLLRVSARVRPTAVSPDGRLLLCDYGVPGHEDVVALPLGGAGKAVPVVSTPGSEYGGSISPDGKWLCYIAADETGRSVFVTPFPGPGGRWQVSTEVAYFAWWNPKGSEVLYFTGDGRVRSVELKIAGGSIQPSAPKTLFSIGLNTNRKSISMAPDGKTFYAIVSRSQASIPATLVTNFDTVLK